MIRLVKCDVLHIGYPKAASMFIRNYLRNHPSCTVDHNCAADVLLSPNERIEIVDKPDKSKVHVSSDESIAESVITDGSGVWQNYCKVPDAWWSYVCHHATISPEAVAGTFQKLYPR